MPRKPKIGRMEAHHTGVKRSKVKVTRPINVVTDNAPYADQKNYNFPKISLLVLILVYFVMLSN